MLHRIRVRSASPRAHLVSAKVRFDRWIRFQVATTAPRIFSLLEAYVSNSPTHLGMRRRIREAILRGSHTSLIFIHIPKTAGTSIRASLRKELTVGYLEVYGLGDLVRWFRSNDTLPSAVALIHLPVRFLRDLGFPIDSNSESLPYIFTTVRDPVARFASALVDAHRKGLLPKKFSARDAIEILARSPLKPNDHVRRLVTTFFAPQCKFVDGVDPGLLKVFRVEDLDDSSRIWPGQTLPLPRENLRSRREVDSDALSSEQLPENERSQILGLYALDRPLVGDGPWVRPSP